MNKLMMAVACLFLGACAMARAEYRTEVIVTPGPVAQQYVVQFKIMDVTKGGKSVLSTPKITVKTGEEGKVSIADAKDQDGVLCTVLVKEIEGGIEAVTTVLVKEEGAEKLNTTQTVVVKK